MIKLLVTDIDGTLITDKNELTAENKSAIQAAVRAGVKVVIATGRMHVGATKIWNELGLDTPIISYQGAMIYDFIAKKPIFSEKLDKRTVLDILDYVRNMGLYVHIYDDDVFYCNRRNNMTALYEKATSTKGIEHANIEDYVPEDGCPKVLIVDKSEHMKEYRADAQRLFGDKTEITGSNFYMLEFMNKGVSKGRAILRLAEEFGIHKDEIIACGDGWNDKSMIEAAGIGVAVRNAAPELKAAADYIAPSNNENAIADVIDRFILKGEHNGNR